MFRWVSGASAALLFAFPALAAADPALPRALARLSPDDFAGRTAVVDDPRAGAVVLTTAGAHRGGQPMTGAFADDVHLRAAIDRSTGQVTWQVWHDLINFPGKARVTAVEYRFAAAVQASSPAQVSTWQDVCQMADTNAPCHVYQRVVFELPEAAVREIAASWQAGSRRSWPLRFKAAAGKDIVGGLAPAEAAGLLRAVENWRKGKAAAAI